MDLTVKDSRINWKVTVIVPTLDEEETIAEVLEQVKPYADELIVIDGKSEDRTKLIANEAGVKVVTDNGMGKGSAIRLGLQIASNPIVVFIDADGSHEASDIPKLLAPIRQNQADIVIGSRMTGGSDELFYDAAELIRLTGSMLINLTINYRWNVRLSDTQNGYRAVVRDAGLALNMVENSTTIEQEMVMKALTCGYRVANVPSHEYRRKGGKSKVIVSKVWVKYLLNVIRHLVRQT
ncbi:MAG: glycosyltransferase family 2 protein [Nitrospirae bacterium]|nr:glycosyltransferase family 2 protein [Nitrospirota bacterium]